MSGWFETGLAILMCVGAVGAGVNGICALDEGDWTSGLLSLALAVAMAVVGYYLAKVAHG